MSVWLIGAGPMAAAYAKVLSALGVEFNVVGRGPASARTFTQATGLAVHVGGVGAALEEIPPPTHAIVAVGVEHLAETASALVRAGVRQILLEKPGALNLTELCALQAMAKASGTQVWVAYNRRFFSSTLAAEEMIEQDGGLTSMLFEFTEWAHVIEPLQKGPGVKERWLLGNSTHVIDLALHLGGLPSLWQGWHVGALDWHPASARFSGAGLTNRNVLFSYMADWEAPGRWGLELLTRRRRLILKPLEKLQMVSSGSVQVEPVVLDDRLDVDFKAGVYRMTAAFIDGDTARMCSLDEQVENAGIYCRIAGYPLGEDLVGAI